ncbi:MAG: hypothetical protein U0401_26380 [Anaerolineae bacterium]
MIDGDLRKAMLFSFFAFALSLVGLIHAERIGLSLSPITIGYLGVTILFGLFQFGPAQAFGLSPMMAVYLVVTILFGLFYLHQ